MTGHATAFLVKWVVTFLALWFVALFFPLDGAMNWLHCIWLSLLIAAVGYAMDLFVPRAFNHFLAIGVDFVVAAIVVYFGNYLFWDMRISWTFALFCGLLIAGCEIFLHAKFVRTKGM